MTTKDDIKANGYFKKQKNLIMIMELIMIVRLVLILTLNLQVFYIQNAFR
ncbi:MAG: hypothetical protein GX222_01115 [Ruminococcaceae bacterium]|nr:hypothetical protein [Oscillospiraceae bacterium]